MKNIHKLILISILILATNISQCFAFSISKFANLYDTEDNAKETYIVSLRNGDVFTCNILDCIDAPDNKQNPDNFIPYILIRLYERDLILYEDEILDINIKKYANTLTNQLYLLPTANPISNNHFIGNWELMLFYGGIGITDWVSITAGRTILPYTTGEQQVSLVNAKVSFPTIGDVDSSNLAIAIGGNMAWLNAHNRLLHFYGVATYNSLELYNSNFTFGFFYKLGYGDYYDNVHFFDGRNYPFDYADGGFGLCAGFERRLEKRKDLSLIMEIWNADVASSFNTGFLFGLRLKGKHLRSDFGLAVFTNPFVLPFCSFVWTPFSND
ncbi:MAG: hypothetical protein LBO69_07880 [Ignavibacteria bacterium]|jgi:hypothetical protein|nr:hypothetical protein [Ignavibacteria bacterium]